MHPLFVLAGAEVRTLFKITQWHKQNHNRQLKTKWRNHDIHFSHQGIQGIQGKCANTELLHEHNHNMIIHFTIYNSLTALLRLTNVVIYTDLLTELNTDILCGDGEQKNTITLVNEWWVWLTQKTLTNGTMKKFVRSGIRTHAYRCRLRPERSALDHSAILTIAKRGSCRMPSSATDLSGIPA